MRIGDGHRDGPGDTYNTVSDGIIIGPLIMGRDITVTLPTHVSVVPSELPAAPPGFTGREEALSQLLDALAPQDVNPVAIPGGSVVVSAVGGMGGVGKTALAVQAAHQAVARGWCPGGVLFIDLFGYDDTRRRAPGEALEHMLRALGMPSEHIPSDVEARMRMYRSVLAEFGRRGQRVLVVADNAGTEQQVEMLLPADGVSIAIVTSRHTLGMLNARLLDLAVLSEPEAVQMLDRVLKIARSGDTRVAERSQDAALLVRLCGYLPLAVRIVAAQLAGSPQLTVAALTRELRQTAPLGGLRYGTDAVASAFALSYKALDSDQQRMFRMFSINPASETTTQAAAVLTGLAESDARRLLRDLERAHLVEPARDYDRWRMHDLVQEYATELEQDQAHSDGRRQALERLVRAYYGWVNYAFDLQNRNNPLVDTDYLETWLKGHPPGIAEISDARSPVDWFESEVANVVALVRGAAQEDPPPEMTVRFACSLFYFLEISGRYSEWAEVEEIAQRVAHTGSDLLDQARSLRNRGRLAMVSIAESGQERLTDDHQPTVSSNAYDDAIFLLESSLAAYRAEPAREGPRRRRALAGEATVLRELADVYRSVADPADSSAVERAVTAYQGAETIYESLGNSNALASLRLALGRTYALDQNRLEEAERCYLFSLEYASGVHQGKPRHGRLMGYSLRRLADLHAAKGMATRAAEYYGRSADAFLHAVNDPISRARALALQGRALADSGDLDSARSRLTEASELFARLRTANDDPEYQVISRWLRSIPE